MNFIIIVILFCDLLEINLFVMIILIIICYLYLFLFGYYCKYLLYVIKDWFL